MKFENHKEAQKLVDEIMKWEYRISLLENCIPDSLILKFRSKDKSSINDMVLPTKHEELKFHVEQTISTYKHFIFLAKTKLEKL